MLIVTAVAGEGTDPLGYMTAHAAMSSGVSAACDVLQTVITSRIKSVLPLQVTQPPPPPSASRVGARENFLHTPPH